MLCQTANIPQAVMHSLIGLTPGAEYNTYAGCALRPLRSRNAVMLLLSLYFSDPNGDGAIRSFNVRKAAQDLGCSLRTVRYCLGVLNDAGYLCFQRRPDNSGRIEIHLSYYDDMFKAAKYGGLGYVTIDQDIYHSFFECGDVVSLRGMIRMYLDSEAAARGQGDTAGTELTYQYLRTSVSSHFTRKKVKALVQTPFFQNIFQTDVDPYLTCVAIRDDHMPPYVKDRLCAEAANAVKKRIAVLNEEQKQRGSKAMLNLLPGELDDIKKIAYRYPVRSILYGIDMVFIRYIRRGLQMDSLGAVVRTFARQNAIRHGWTDETTDAA